MPRISLPTLEDMTPAQRAVYDKVVSGPRGSLRGPLRAALHNPELADRWQALGELLRYRTTLAPRLSELAILVTARHCRSPFEWYAHRPEAQKAGVPAAVIDAVLAGSRPEGLRDDEAAAYEYASQLNASNSVSASVHRQAVAQFGERGTVELTALVGYYTMVAMTLNAHEIPMPEGVAPAFRSPQEEELR
ncbi:MAG TPA: carboxymuconolactone decarboxylase family protein [Ramlibacter sp.]|uniref:carboxymuconolactone decarboxylase family protein n=1 Tax=Ramlibacter sp. TaxID=1917967 RepID=UPI002CA783A4|nr:carboxymuconolactone decarboxylase family protein [Ramlibacter sp.]HVZ44005.1 carboxymuconolactone decarboxylase family protein [Ramlibacter sp.]